MYRIPEILAENPHSHLTYVQGRYQLFDRMEQQEDQTFKVPEDDRDSKLLKEYRALISKFSDIKYEIILLITGLIDSHMEKVLEEKQIDKSHY